jgi:FkbM family methyltransferase
MPSRLQSTGTWWRLARSRVRTIGRADVAGFSVRFNDGPNFVVTYNDIFVHGIYCFSSSKPDPRILDCGANIGLSCLYFKYLYPYSRVIAFEPDPSIYPFAQANIADNGLNNVELIQAAVSNQVGSMQFYSDGKYGSALEGKVASDIGSGWRQYEVPTIRMREYLDEPVDFLKMNIEGSEWEVLLDSEDRLEAVKQMVIEYHHLPGLPRTLHKILELLNRHGFEYVVSDFDLPTYGNLRPPMQLDGSTRYYRHVFASRL